MKNKVFISLLTIFLLLFCMSLNSASFTVNTTDDTVDVNPGDGVAADVNGNCSLRAAIMEANALSGSDIIELPEGIYKLTIKGIIENDCRKGDLDIKSTLEIRGQGMDTTIIDGNQIDRVFHIKGSWKVKISDLTVRNGKTPDVADIPQSRNYEAIQGGGIYNDHGILALKNLIITKNQTGNGGNWCYRGGDGGGIYNVYGSILKISNSMILENSTGNGKGPFGWGGDGGGIYNQGDLNILNSSIVKNKTGNAGKSSVGYGGGSGGRGGGIFNNVTMIVTQCQISGNCTGDGGGDCGDGGDGGGIFNCSFSNDSVIINSTISNNITGDGVGVCDNGGHGGGIFNFHKISLINCTVTNNIISDKGRGGGIYNDYSDKVKYSGFASTDLKNSIIANNKRKTRGECSDCIGMIINSHGYNLIENASRCAIKGETELIGLDPKLGPLADNGGPTKTHALLHGSPCIDSGDPDSFKHTDQRGILRPKDGDKNGVAISDIGAFELFEPYVKITHPKNGAVISGIQIIQVDTDCKKVDFYINSKLKHTVNSSPFTYEWDTILYSNGLHVIKANTYDVPGVYFSDEITVNVENIIINLNISRYEERAWIIKKQCSKIIFNVENRGNLPVSKYIIYRKEEGGEYSSIKEVLNSEVQIGAYTYNDLNVNKNTTYIYQIKALDTEDVVIGISQEKSI
jgi:CSLREA domain-containing protein